MRYRIVTVGERPRLRRDFRRLHGVAWPDFLRDDAVSALWPRLDTDRS